MKDKPLYRQIFDVLYAGISEGRYVDGRLPTDGQLVRRFKTTRTTVAKAMHELESAELMALRINNDKHPPRRILLETQLIVRQSSVLSS